MIALGAASTTGSLACTPSLESRGSPYTTLTGMHAAPLREPSAFTAQWPPSVPIFDAGTLILATAQGPGSTTALWETTRSLDSTIGRYDAVLSARGFINDGGEVIRGQQIRDYLGPGYRVRVVASRTGRTTGLTVTIRST